MEYDVEKISNKIKNKRMTKKIFKYIILTVLIILFIINLILSFDENAHIGGIYMFNIISESMRPTLDVNDVVVVKKCNPQELQVGDIITFTQEGRTISHRILRIAKDEEVWITTKGDNNEIPDKDEINGNQVCGKALFRIRKIGKAVNYIQNVSGFLNIAIFIIILYILVSLRDKHKNERKMKRRKYEIKRKRDNYQL